MSVCVVGAGFNAAVSATSSAKCIPSARRATVTRRWPSAWRMSRDLPIPPMLDSAVDRNYPRTIQHAYDTSAPMEVLRNGVIFNAESAVILSGPATYLAKTLDLLNVKDLYKDRVKRLVIVDSGTPYNDAAAIRRVIAEWPTPVFFCPKEVGDALKFPGAQLDKDFAWAPAHPIVDAYKAY